MKTKRKILCTLALVFASFISYAQVGIGTETPEGALDIVSTDSGLVLPRVANTTSVTTPVNGMMIYDLSSHCVKVYQDGEWSNCTASTGGSVTSLDNCDSPTTTGTLENSVAASGVSFTINYSGGDGGSYSGETVNSTTVTGLTATLTAGTFSTGSGSVTYNVSGTPNNSGTANFNISLGGQTCTVSLTVNDSLTIPPELTLEEDQSYFIASIFDEDYLPYTSPTGAATTATQAADGSNEVSTIDVQGTLSTSGVTLGIPIANITGSTTLGAFSQTINVPSNLTEDGISRDVNLSWASQALTTSSTEIVITLSAIGGDLNAVKLDVNAGVGNDALGVLLAEFTYPYNNAGDTTSFSFRDISGIPDLEFGDGVHDFLYLPVTGEDGNVWLNNNLGAHYSNIHHASFNPAQQATSANDFNAYGSLYQWGRLSDGHEIINWISATASDGAEQSRETSTQSTSTTPGHDDFILQGGFAEWLDLGDQPAEDMMWQGLSGTNNPCPQGFRIPTNELTDIANAAGITNSATALASNLAFPTLGFRNNVTGELANVGTEAHYWRTVVSSVLVGIRRILTNSSDSNANGRAAGASVRCVKD